MVIYDYADTGNPDDESDKRIDLKEEIEERVGDEKRIDVLAFSHFGKDHYQGASELFWLEHAEKYQSDDRIEFDTMWVPAAAILEEGITEEG